MQVSGGYAVAGLHGTACAMQAMLQASSERPHGMYWIADNQGWLVVTTDSAGEQSFRRLSTNLSSNLSG